MTEDLKYQNIFLTNLKAFSNDDDFISYFKVTKWETSENEDNVSMFLPILAAMMASTVSFDHMDDVFDSVYNFSEKAFSRKDLKIRNSWFSLMQGMLLTGNNPFYTFKKDKFNKKLDRPFVTTKEMLKLRKLLK